MANKRELALPVRPCAGLVVARSSRVLAESFERSVACRRTAGRSGKHGESRYMAMHKAWTGGCALTALRRRWLQTASTFSATLSVCVCVCPHVCFCVCVRMHTAGSMLAILAQAAAVVV